MLHCFIPCVQLQTKIFSYFFKSYQFRYFILQRCCSISGLFGPIEVPLILIDCACASSGVKLFQLVVPRQVLKISATKSVCTLKRQCFIWKLNCTKTYSTQTVGHCSNTERNFLFIFQAGNLDCFESSLSCETISLFKTKTKITWWMWTIP